MNRVNWLWSIIAWSSSSFKILSLFLSSFMSFLFHLLFLKTLNKMITYHAIISSVNLESWIQLIFQFKLQLSVEAHAAIQSLVFSSPWHSPSLSAFQYYNRIYCNSKREWKVEFLKNHSFWNETQMTSFFLRWNVKYALNLSVYLVYYLFSGFRKIRTKWNKKKKAELLVIQSIASVQHVNLGCWSKDHCSSRILLQWP